MCIAICKPSGVKIAKRILKACFKSNPDGAGFAYASPEQGKVILTKGFFSFRSFWEHYREIDPENRSVLIHFRVSTSGKIDSVNCHPWRIDEKHAMIHNGMLTSRFPTLKSEEYSDTGLFTHTILKPLFLQSQNAWKTEAFEWMLEEAIGGGNKIAIMDHTGEFKIFNKHLGENEHGAWFSNKTYKEERVRNKTTSKSSNFYSKSFPATCSVPDSLTNPHSTSPPEFKRGFGPSLRLNKSDNNSVALSAEIDFSQMY